MMYGSLGRFTIGAVMPPPNARVTLTDGAVSVVRDCLRDFDEGLNFSTDHYLLARLAAQEIDEEGGKAFVRLPLEEQEILARAYALRERAEEIVARIRDAQLQTVHQTILRKYPILANEWREVQDIKVDQLPEKLRGQILGADFTHDEFVRIWLDGVKYSPNKVYELTAPWQEWARENGLHPAFSPTPTPIAPLSSPLVRIANDSHARTVTQTPKLKKTTGGRLRIETGWETAAYQAELNILKAPPMKDAQWSINKAILEALPRGTVKGKEGRTPIDEVKAFRARERKRARTEAHEKAVKYLQTHQLSYGGNMDSAREGATETVEQNYWRAYLEGGHRGNWDYLERALERELARCCEKVPSEK